MFLSKNWGAFNLKQLESLKYLGDRTKKSLDWAPKAVMRKASAKGNFVPQSSRLSSCKAILVAAIATR